MRRRWSGVVRLFVAGDLTSVVDPATGHVLPPLAQIALDQAVTVAHTLVAELAGELLEPYQFRYKGSVVCVGRADSWRRSFPSRPNPSVLSSPDPETVRTTMLRFLVAWQR